MRLRCPNDNLRILSCVVDDCMPVNNLDRLLVAGYSTANLKLGVEVAYRPDAEAIKGKPVNFGYPQGFRCISILMPARICRSQSGAVPQL